MLAVISAFEMLVHSKTYVGVNELVHGTPLLVDLDRNAVVGGVLQCDQRAGLLAVGDHAKDPEFRLSGGAEVQLYRMHVVLVTAYRHVRHIVSRIIGQPDRPLAVLAHCQA